MKAITTALTVCALGCIIQGYAAEAQTETVLYSFCKLQNCPDGRNPLAGLIAVNGTLYGTTPGGGTGSFGGPGGTVYSLDPQTGAETVVYSFCSQQSCADGGYPLAGLLDVNGTFYGTTLSGGSSTFCGDGCGTVYSLNPGTGAETVAYSFCSQTGCSDGYYPAAGVIAVKGALYGTTKDGGSHGNGGTVFSLNPTSGAEETLHSFQADPGDGLSSQAAVINIRGTLYGTTAFGGKDARGTVFALRNKGKHMVHSFGLSYGLEPLAGLIDAGGTLYGTTYYGGSIANCTSDYGCGTVFSLDPATGAEAPVYSFGANADGTNPAAGLINVNGTLYGTTSEGGGFGGGTVFSIDPKSGAETVLYSFCTEQGCTDGEYPRAGLVNINGTLYGTTYKGGKYNFGTVFSITP
jgi:uncharacterized repeat protein (TIGR03803 family)